MIRIFSRMNPTVASIGIILQKLRKGVIMTLWLMLLVSILLNKLRFRAIFALITNLVCFICPSIMNEMTQFIFTTPLYLYCIYSSIFEAILNLHSGIFDKKVITLDLLYVFIYLLAILITWRSVQLFKYVSRFGAWEAVVYVDQDQERAGQQRQPIIIQQT